MEFVKTYPSGLRVVAKLMPSSYAVSLGVYVNVGSIREDKEVNGYSHFIEHLLFKGTAKRKPADISEEMDDIGAQLNAFTSKDNTCYFTKSASGDLSKCRDLLSDMYFNASFDEVEIDKERNVVLEEIASNDDRPEDVCQDLIAEALYKDQKLGQTILGNAKNIQYCDRHSIINYKSKYYVASNTVISVAGNFDIDNLDKLIVSLFESNFGRAEKPKTAIDDEEISVPSADYLQSFKDCEQSHLCLALPAISMGDAAAPQYLLMSSALGGGMSSRLFQNIREQNGLAYSVYAFPSLYKNSGYLEIYCGTNPENVVKVTDLLQKTIKDFIDGGITEKELARAKTQAINGQLMGLEDSLNVMMANGRRMLKLNKTLDIEERTNSFKSVSLKQINDVIAKVFSQNFASCYVGKQHKDSDVISKIKF
jgi:predicted Zn-dependent peptidase